MMLISLQVESEIEEEAEDVYRQLLNEEKENVTAHRLIQEFPVRYRNLKDVIIVVNEAFRVLYNPEVEAIPDTYLIIAIISHWLTRYYCKRLMQVLTPEGLAVHFNKIPDSLRKCYIYHQEHFCLKSLIERHQQKMQLFR